MAETRPYVAVCEGVDGVPSHEWIRPISHGQRPRWCPEHRARGAYEAQRANKAAWRAANLERVREYHREHSAAWREAHADRIRERDAAYRAEHREQMLEQKVAWRAANQDRTREYNAARRARVSASGVVKRGVTWRTVAERDGMGCYLCGETADPGDFTPAEESVSGYWKPGPTYPSLDHVLPLSKGGAHDMANAKLAHMTCNLRKGSRVN